MSQIIRGALRDPRFTELYADQMFRLRAKVFHERLGWDVKVNEQGLEIDCFDDHHSAYIVTSENGRDVTGSWRLRPTTETYMLRNIFPQLLNGHAVPSDRRIWEISRFAVDTSESSRTSGFSLGRVARDLVRDTVEFALKHHIEEYVLVTSVAVERLLASIGLDLRRYGPPVKIGRVWSVACSVKIDAHTCEVVLGDSLPLQEAA